MIAARNPQAPASAPVLGPPPSVRRWLGLVYLMILAMVVVGGITRLTGSGLSMVEWRPLMGAIPPIGDDAWNRVFAEYQATPQYQLVNDWMTLGDFKRIFFWEYVHRLLGRVIGVAVFVPWLYFLIRRRFDRHLALHTFGLFVAGGMQGVLGWWMVKSGLVDEPSVSHLRLAAHLGLALFLACWTLWLWLGERRRAAGVAPVRGTPLRRFGAAALLGMVSLQMIYGAFMAGTHAGLLFSTFPDMNSEWVPSGIGALTPFLWDLVENPVTIHFVHRTLGWVVFFAVFVALVFGRDADDAPERARRRWLVGALTLVQFSLGVATVMTGVSLPLAVSHQLGGVLLLSACVAYVESHFARVRHTTT